MVTDKVTGALYANYKQTASVTGQWLYDFYISVFGLKQISTIKAASSLSDIGLTPSLSRLSLQ